MFVLSSSKAGAKAWFVLSPAAFVGERAPQARNLSKSYVPCFGWPGPLWVGCSGRRSEQRGGHGDGCQRTTASGHAAGGESVDGAD